MTAVGFMSVAAIVNPLAGAGADDHAAAQRVALLTARFRSAGIDATISVTERPRHARELAASALAGGATLVVAWGGDGTINEIGGVIAGTAATMAIIPAGSGNGLAAELGLPWTPDAAIDVAIGGRDRMIDAGEIDGRLFFNIGGVGFDAAIAARFNAREMGKRGMGSYVRIGLAEALGYRSHRYRLHLDGEALETTALVIAFANGREYGNRLRVAPHALVDDGRLEVVVVEDRRPLQRLWTGRHLVLGTAVRARGVILRSVAEATVEADGPIAYHADGETGQADGLLKVRIRPAHLRVRVPAGGTR